MTHAAGVFGPALMLNLFCAPRAALLWAQSSFLQQLPWVSRASTIADECVVFRFPVAAQSSAAVSGQADVRGGMGRGDALDCRQADA